MVQLNAGRRVSGVLRGFDAFLNIILEDATEERSATERLPIGQCVIRGNSVLVMEPMERVVA